MLEGFQVDVRGPGPHRLAEQGIEQADDRRVVLLLQQVARLRQGFSQLRQVDFLVQALNNRLRGILARAIATGQALGEVGIADTAQVPGTAHHTAGLGHGGQRSAFSHQQGRLSRLAVEQDAVTSGKAERQFYIHQRGPGALGRTCVSNIRWASSGRVESSAARTPS
ncbi:hypothetical protein D9M71_374490 [compost metagenome]